MKRSSEIEQLNCFKNCSKSRLGKNVEFDCGENLNNLRHVTRTSDLFNWILALMLSNIDKHFILSGEPLSDKIMNIIISKFNDLIVPYSKEGHNHRLQPIKAKLSQLVPYYKEVDGSFVQILKIYKFRWVVATNFNLRETDNNDKTIVHTVYIFDAFLNASFRKKANEVKYPISFIQDICNIVSRPKNEIKFVLLNVPQTSKREYAGFYAVAFTYLILRERIVLCRAINQALLPEHLIKFLEHSIYSQNIFTECKNFSHPTTYISFTERLYYHCVQPDIGERMKECDCCKNQHCENFERISNTNISLSQWYCPSCDQIPFVHINSFPYLVLGKFFMELCITDEKMPLTLALVCKKCKSFINENFIERVHIQWLDQEYHANT